jgi:hypothetical protein
MKDDERYIRQFLNKKIVVGFIQSQFHVAGICRYISSDWIEIDDGETTLLYNLKFVLFICTEDMYEKLDVVDIKSNSDSGPGPLPIN